MAPTKGLHSSPYLLRPSHKNIRQSAGADVMTRMLVPTAMVTITTLIGEHVHNIYNHSLSILSNFSRAKLIIQTMSMPNKPITTCLCRSVRILRGGFTSNSYPPTLISFVEMSRICLLSIDYTVLSDFIIVFFLLSIFYTLRYYIVLLI